MRVAEDDARPRLNAKACVIALMCSFLLRGASRQLQSARTGISALFRSPIPGHCSKIRPTVLQEAATGLGSYHCAQG